MPRIARRPSIVVGGITPFTTIDFPGRLAAVIFCQGCPWRCPYCHNPHLQPLEAQTNNYSWEDISAWLDRRRGLLSGVVFSGGEPLLQPGLQRAMIATRTKGFAIGLHTAGVSAKRMGQILPYVDWVGFDVKAPWEKYPLVTGGGHAKTVRECLSLLIESGVPYDVRCTVAPDLLTPDDVAVITEQLAETGARPLVLQPYRPPQAMPQISSR